MSTIVVKVGGPSLASTESIRLVAKRIIKERQCGHDVVVVCSAMGRKSKELVELAAEITDEPSKREMDILLSASSQVTAALFTMALQEQEQDAVAWTGVQAGIVTDGVYRHARIECVDKQRYIDTLQQGKLLLLVCKEPISLEK